VITGIGAVAANGTIGLDNWLPWDIPDELAHFEHVVTGHALVVGRLTYDSMEVVPVNTFVVSQHSELPVRPGCVAVSAVGDALVAAQATGREVFVIGGASIYAAAWPYLDRFLLTHIEKEFAGDTWFPEIPLNQWPIVSEQRRTLHETKSASDVVCRIVDYRNPHPQRLRKA
jgi:dihydrofolate reductase